MRETTIALESDPATFRNKCRRATLSSRGQGRDTFTVPQMPTYMNRNKRLFVCAALGENSNGQNKVRDKRKTSRLPFLLVFFAGFKQVMQWAEEEKRQRKLVALLKGQRDIKQAEAMRAQQAEKDTAQQVHTVACCGICVAGEILTLFRPILQRHLLDRLEGEATIVERAQAAVLCMVSLVDCFRC